jgi:transketolase
MRATREGFGQGLKELAQENPNVVALTADLGGSTNATSIQSVDPKRYLQIGIAEANMVDVAAGLATCGKIPFPTTFAMFGTGRAWESWRNSVCYPALNVKLTCTHSGLSVGPDGASHQSLEDIAITRAIPNCTVVVAADWESARQLTHAVAAHDGPCYLRLGRAKLADVYKDRDTKLKLGRGEVLREGTDVALIACGPCVAMALEAADTLAAEGISATVVDMHTVKPIDAELVARLAETCGAIVTAEEHNVIGGLGGAVSEVVCESVPCPVERVGTKDTFGESGEHPELWEKYGLTSANIALHARKAVGRKAGVRA